MRSLTSSFKKNPTKKDDAIKFMDRLLKNGHAEKAPPLTDGEECWFLPIFGVYHPRKPTQIRMVFDASASFAGTSLKSVLLPGPNMTNSLLGILLRFRKERVAAVGDIEQMFHSFKIRQNHRNFVRFVWFEDNNPEKPLIDYRMCVHLFGNSPSPAVATYCLRKCVAGDLCDAKIKEFVDKNFYVDDGLVSFTSGDEALDVLLRTQTTLKEQGRIRFHKFASNDPYVMDALPPEDRAKDLSDIDLELSSAPTQRSLGLGWNLESDNFVFNSVPKEPQIQVTKREILSGLNSLYDPLGFLSPVILQGRYIFRDVVNSSVGWDDAVPLEVDLKWKNWCCSLHHLLDVNIPRMFVPTSLKESNTIELHTFSDASKKAVSAVSYLRVISGEDTYVGFAFGKSKLSPCHGHTIPRLELCAAVLASEIAQFVCKQLDVNIRERKFYTDSRVVLGYIYNRTKRFHTYVSNWVQRIHLETLPEEWTHVSSELNPADVGTRSCMADELSGMWFNGSGFLHTIPSLPEDPDYPLQSPEDDKEIRSETKITTILQEENFGQEIANLKSKKPIPKSSPLRYLDAYLDDDGVLRVGGRIRTGDALSGQGHIIIPGKTHLTRLIVLHLHEKTRHQGRNILEGAVRSAGYWVIGAKRLVSSIIHACVTCRKLRRKLECQKMAKLPEFRTQPTPPFTYVGVDTFGPWEVSTRKTRGGAANAKRWAILFTCMTSRAVHIELVEEMSSAAFINALRRFVSLREKVTEFHSDRGTNFVGSTDALRIDAINVENPTVRKFFADNGSTWIFNPPHASHMGGVWERVIGTARRILEGIIVTESRRNLTHDILSTFMCEVCAIINSRPIASVSVDPSQPSILSPSTLLTQKQILTSDPLRKLTLRTLTGHVGNMFKLWPISSGRDGKTSICIHFSLDGSGSAQGTISRKGMLFYSKKKVQSDTTGL
ncbi:uncharacterized protein LOC117344719 [Pecten maximus]|uniref:uncharacterized protein LOC117344719 n=1 Tax=Pecten maximus TaxID=6579 RepID=UPI001458E9E0|nr:uncharacterized protein LOC117344719 [Pecten maximus]